MTLEDMIMDIDSAIEGDGIPEKCGQAIIAALRAGQDMRKETEVSIEHLRTEGYLRQAQIMERCCDAWDAATKEDV